MRGNTTLGQAFRAEMPAAGMSAATPSRGDGVVRFGDESRAPEAIEPPGIDRPTVTDLGTATVNGLETVGMRYEHTIPAGAMGNREPMTVMTTIWRSRDFGFDLPVRTEVADPFSGRSVQELRNIRVLAPGEGENLFRPDPGWNVVETPARVSRRLDAALPQR
ncbi:MAG: hypothetical protein OXH68_10655 [Gammaproteobacteria bacterium]|nr:hypothetical protein [Gammaproteobacteria bacterium]